ncbi:hypothetical protein NXU89_08160 [Bacteroides uniformis]|nr:hypothetical protein [Bacteroides uniformis]
MLRQIISACAFKRQGFDPRVAMAGSDDEYGGYSPMRVISGGINLTF